MLRVLRGVFYLAVISVVIGISFLYFYLNQPIPLTTEKNVVVPHGMRRMDISKKLATEGIIQYPQTFAVISYAFGKKPILAGEYAFGPGFTTLQVMQLLQSGKVVLRKLTIPEGYTVWQALQLVDKADGLTGELPKDIQEGSLFPETYYFTFGDSKADVVARMQAKQKQVMAELGVDEKILTLASIVEKETGVMDERAKVAGVFANRLKKDMLLQTDPTVQYAVTNHTGVLDRPLSLKDLGMDSPYNTYINAGLPPGPICNPGLAALKAAAKPDETDALYFVASGEGGHLFARTLEEHNRNVAKYRAMIREKKADAAEEGKK